MTWINLTNGVVLKYNNFQTTTDICRTKAGGRRVIHKKKRGSMMEHGGRSLKAYLYFEWLFWIAACVPLCLLASQKLVHFSSNIFPSHRGFFGVTGIVCMAIFVIAMFFYRPLCRLFTSRTVPYLSMGVILAGLACGVIYGEKIAYCAQEAGALLDIPRFLCMMGSGIWLILCLVLLVGSVWRLFRPGSVGRVTAIWWVVLPLLGLAMLYLGNLHFGY